MARTCLGVGISVSTSERNVPSTGPTERVTNGDFSSSVGWSPGPGWVISGGSATATTTINFLTNTLIEPVANGASCTFSVDLENLDGEELQIVLYNSSTNATSLLYAGTGTGHIATTPTAGSGGPYDQLRIKDVDGGSIVNVDNVSLIA